MQAGAELYKLYVLQASETPIHAYIMNAELTSVCNALTEYILTWLRSQKSNKDKTPREATQEVMMENLRKNSILLTVFFCERVYKWLLVQEKGPLVQ